MGLVIAYLPETCTIGQKLEIGNKINYHLIRFALKCSDAKKNELQIFFARFGSLKHFAALVQLKFSLLRLECSLAQLLQLPLQLPVWSTPSQPKFDRTDPVKIGRLRIGNSVPI